MLLTKIHCYANTHKEFLQFKDVKRQITSHILKYIWNEYNLNQINQLAINQFTLLSYNHMNVIMIKYIQNHTSSINCLQ